MRSPTALECPMCREVVLADDHFCEGCGARLSEEAATVDEVAPHHAEQEGSAAAAVTDRGFTHRTNEDAFFVADLPDGRTVAVVCDGVSASASPHLAARVAADAAGRTLAAAVDASSGDPVEATVAALDAAQVAVASVRSDDSGEYGAPACTIVCAAWDGDVVTVGWVGDSRAYWISDTGGELLTTDNSWAEEQIASGTMTWQEAAADRRAHAITRWLGSDAPALPHQVQRFRPARSGLVILCSDGLWNYAPRGSDLAELVADARTGAGPLALARSLTNIALAAGGRDNVTVAVLEVRPKE